MGSLILDIRQGKSHTIDLPVGTEELLREPIASLDGKVSVMVTRAAKGTHHRKGISLKPRPTGSYEIRGTVQPGANKTCREFVAQVHPPLKPETVYSLWKDPPQRIKKQAVDPPLSKESIESFRQAVSVPRTISPFNLNEFWKVEEHLDEALSCLTADDLKDDVVDGDAFRTAVRLVLEARGLNPVALDLAQSLSTLTRLGRVNSIGNTRPFRSYRLSKTTTVKEEAVATIIDAERNEVKEIETKETQAEFVLKRFWQRNPRALEELGRYFAGHSPEDHINRLVLGQAIRDVIQAFGGAGNDRQISSSLQALNLMGVIVHVSGDKTSYYWKGLRGLGSNKRKPWVKTPLIDVVGLADTVDELLKFAEGDEHLLSKAVLYEKLRGLYVERTGGQPTKTMIGHAVHRLFKQGALETRGLNDAKTYHLTRQAIADVTSRKVVAPKVDAFSGPLPLTEILEALTKAAGSDRCLQIRIAVVTVSKTANCDEDKATELIDELLKNGYLHLVRGRDLCTHKITAKAELYLKEKKKGDPPVELANSPEPLAPESFKEVDSPASSSHSADDRAFGDATPTNGFGQLAKMSAALQTIDCKIEVERERMTSAQAIVASAQKAIAELEADRTHLSAAKEALEQATKEAADLTAKYAE